MSNLIKYSRYVPIEDKKMILIVDKPLPSKIARVVKDDQEDQLSEQEQMKLDAKAEIDKLKAEILKDAEEYAESQIKEAMIHTDQIKEKAKLEIEEWWNEKRQQDIEHIEAAKQQGLDQGYTEGAEQAAIAIKEQYSTFIQEAQTILEYAHEQKQVIIQEAEPFLIELSCEISKKIINHQLTLSQEWVVDLVKNVLIRKREQGMITLCVSPAHFTIIQDASEELALVVDSQAELQIIPDRTVEDHGCVVRSSLGSIDARIDTQLTEIKNALKQLALISREDEPDDQST